MKTGIFIVIEGIDGSGITTQSELLANWFSKKGFHVFLTSEPSEGGIGKLLRAYLKNNSINPAIDALLFAADRVEHTEIIKKKLEEGYVVISSRYFESSIAYQSSQGIPIEWIEEINKYAIIPDITIILDAPPEVTIERVKKRNSISHKDREKFERIDFLHKVRTVFLSRAREFSNYHTVNATRDINAVHKEIVEIVDEYVKKIFKG
ncbi:MAG: dTMP kinase [Candidatus Odinarchaeota archaeon]|nr:dTMP kinase [Candidatus Odinarchaeota archaeon]